MNLHICMANIRIIQSQLIDFFQKEDVVEDQFTNFVKLLTENRVADNPNEMKLFFRMFVAITNNHGHFHSFSEKLCKILHFYKNCLMNYSPKELLKLFGNNKRILLFLIENGILQIDSDFIKYILRKDRIIDQYLQYFMVEARSFLKEQWVLDELSSNYPELLESIKAEIPTDFQINRTVGDNPDDIFQIIRNDSVEEFQAFLSNNSDLSTSFHPSMYETNRFLINEIQNGCNEMKSITLIEYAAFFGSIKIFEYLKSNCHKLTPSLWLYAIYSNNVNFFHILEESKVELDDKTYLSYFIESIKCHSNDIAKYILMHYLPNNEQANTIMIEHAIKFYNFELISDTLINQLFLCDFCQYDYFSIVEYLSKDPKVNINMIKQMKLVYESTDIMHNEVYNIENIITKSPFCAALENGNLAIVNLLLNNPNTDLNLAFKMEMHKRRFATGNMKSQDEEDYEMKIIEETPLCLAIRKNEIEYVQLLVASNKINVNLPYYETYKLAKDDGTIEYGIKEIPPLHLALQNNHLDIAKFLIANSTVNFHLVDGEGKKAFQCTENEELRYLLQQKASIPSSEIERVVTPITSDTQLFNSYCSKLGLNLEIASFYDIFSFDPELLLFIPQPVYAVIINYPFSSDDNYFINRYSKPLPEDELPKPLPWFTLQTVRNACGTFALLHALLNSPQVMNCVKKQSWLDHFYKKTLQLSPSDRAVAISYDEKLVAYHNSFSKASTVAIPDKVEFHFACFTIVENILWELDGRKPQPICHGNATDVLHDSLKVIQEDFMSHIGTDAQVSMIALAKTSTD